MEVLYVNFSDIDLKWGLPDLWTSDGYKLPGAYGEIRMRIAEGDIPKLFGNMMEAITTRITQDDLFGRIRLELLGSVIAPVIKSQRLDDLWGNKTVIEDCYNSIDSEMRKTLSRWGFNLIQFTINYNFDREWVKWKEEVSKRPQEIDKVKFDYEKGRTHIVGAGEAVLLEQQYDKETAALRQRYDLAMEKNDFAQALEMKRQLDKLKQDRAMGEVQVRQAEEDWKHKRGLERLRTEQEARAQTLQILQQTGAPQTIEKALEQETLQKIVERGEADEAARAIEARYKLEIHEKAEAAAFKQATDLVGAAKTPPAQPVIVPPYPIPTTPATPGKNCPKCKAENPGVAKFCISCGEKL